MNDVKTCQCGKSVEPTPDLDKVLIRLLCSCCIGMCRECKERLIESRQIKCRKCGSLVGCDCKTMQEARESMREERTFPWEPMGPPESEFMEEGA